MFVLIKKRWKNWKLLCPGQHVSFFAVGGLLIGNKFKQNRLDDSDSYLFTDLHAHPVRHKTLTSRVPEESRIPLALFSIRLQFLCSEKVKCQQHVHGIHPLCFFLHPTITSIAPTMHGWRMVDHALLQQGRASLPEVCSHAFVVKHRCNLYYTAKEYFWMSWRADSELSYKNIC